jgi:hypothetical protein
MAMSAAHAARNVEGGGQLKAGAGGQEFEDAQPDGRASSRVAQWHGYPDVPSGQQAGTVI